MMLLQRYGMDRCLSCRSYCLPDFSCDSLDVIYGKFIAKICVPVSKCLDCGVCPLSEDDPDVCWDCRGIFCPLGICCLVRLGYVQVPYKPRCIVKCEICNRISTG